jgi:hypothetical protein
MANADVPMGLIPVNSLGGQYSGSCNVYFIPATDSAAVGTGCPVKYAGSADADGVATVARATAGDAVMGVVVGFVANKDYDSNTHRTASTARYAIVADDPGLLCEVQEDSDGGSLAATSVGLNANLVFGTVNTTTGLSNVELDSSSAATTATLQVKVIGLSRRPDNEIGTNAKWIVKLNNHQHGSHTGTAGV